MDPAALPKRASREADFPPDVVILGAAPLLGILRTVLPPEVVILAEPPLTFPLGVVVGFTLGVFFVGRISLPANNNPPTTAIFKNEVKFLEKSSNFFSKSSPPTCLATFLRDSFLS